MSEYIDPGKYYDSLYDLLRLAVIHNADREELNEIIYYIQEYNTTGGMIVYPNIYHTCQSRIQMYSKMKGDVTCATSSTN